ncbi:MAG: diacylglycerol kinase family protein [Ruminococcus sp.]|nr:diacylglycerol kinase family protein [Ruminococcus sp.]
MSIRTDIGKFFRGFKYAFEGLAFCIRTQRNFRSHLGTGALVLWGSRICGTEGTQKLILLVCIGGVLALEAVNTAVENTVDLISGEERTKLGKAAKDCAAGAVLVFSVFAAAVGCAVFFNGRSLERIGAYFTGSPLRIAAAAGACVLQLVWVFVCFRDKPQDK